jgi:GT2 family glycosyltransferase
VAAMGEALKKYDFVACRFDIEKLNPGWLARSRENPQSDGLQVIWYPPYLPHAGGGGLGVKRFLHQEVGGFDEALPYLHDTDFCFKVQLLGVELAFVKEAVLYVRYRDTYRGTFRQARNYAEYNVILYQKYRSTGPWIIHPWRRYFRDWLSLFERLPQLRSIEGRMLWIWLLGWQIGMFEGSVRHRFHPAVYTKYTMENRPYLTQALTKIEYSKTHL